MRTWEDRRAALIKRMPTGVVLAPFEFGTAVTWLAYGIRLLIDNFTAGADPIRATLPLNGLEFTVWSFMLPLSAALMIIGLVATVVWPIAGLYVERAGLLGMSVTLFTLTYALVVNAHLSLISLAAINAGTTILVVVFRFMIIGSALESFRRQLDADREAH